MSRRPLSIRDPASRLGGTSVRWRRLILIVLFVALQAYAASNEPVTSLRAIDKRLSIINAQMDHLRTAATRAQRNRDIRRIRAAVLQVRHRAIRLEASYRARHQRFGVKMFGHLQRTSRALSRSLTALERARSKKQRERLFNRCTNEALALVLQYQAITANIAANHCAAGQWACCEPKSNPETNRGPAEACRWACVSKRSACVGFTGARTPRSMVTAP